MIETMHGVVAGVRTQDLGDELTTAAVVGDTLLHVSDVADFISDDEGGWLLLAGVLYAYTDVDDDAATITLAAPIPALTPTAPIDTRVDLWDVANGVPAQRNVAVVDDIDGFDGQPAEVTVEQGTAHALAESMRAGRGESVTLHRGSDGELSIAKIHGRAFSLAALQYLQGGMTTRQAEDEAGVDVLGAESGTPGIYAYGAGGAVTVRIDAVTGDATFIGELGTADPGDVGIFMFSNQFSYKGSLHTRPVVQFNTGTNRDQPSIQADAVGSGSGLWIYSGASTGEREAYLSVDNGTINAGIEHTADDGIYDGAIFRVTRDDFNTRTDYQFGGTNVACELLGDGTSAMFGWRDSGGTGLRGLVMARAGGLNLMNSSHIQITTVDGAAYQEVDGGTYNTLSDRRAKADFGDAPDALKIVAEAPARRWRYLEDPKTKRRIGPVADDLPRWLVGRHPKTHDVAPDMQYVGVQDLTGVLWAAVGQLADEVTDMRAQLTQLEK